MGWLSLRRELNHGEITMSETSRERAANAEGFDLRIRIGGLCMLLRDTENKRLHVLMPATPEHHLHYARFKWREGDQARHVELGPALDLTTLGSAKRRKPGSIPKEVVNIGWVAEKKVEWDLLQQLPANRVRCHIQLPAGRATDRWRGARWRIARMKGGVKKTQFMATDIFWRVRMPGPSLRLDDLVPGVPELFPEIYNGRPTVHVQIVSEPARPNTEKPEVGEEADHFDHYYNLFDGLIGHLPLPKFQNDPDGELIPPELLPDRYGMVRCIMSTASLDG